MSERIESSHPNKIKADDRTHINTQALKHTKADNKLNQNMNRGNTQGSHQGVKNRGMNENLQGLEEKNYAQDEKDSKKSKGLAEKKRFNPLNKKRSPEELIQIEHYPLRQQAQICKRIAVLTYRRFKNRGRGDTAVNGIIYASRELIKTSTSLLQKEVTPKRFYEFRNAKIIFQRAKKMSGTDTAFLPYIYKVGDIRHMKKLEEEEDERISKLPKDDEEE